MRSSFHDNVVFNVLDRVADGVDGIGELSPTIIEAGIIGQFVDLATNPEKMANGPEQQSRSYRLNVDGSNLQNRENIYGGSKTIEVTHVLDPDYAIFREVTAAEALRMEFKISKAMDSEARSGYIVLVLQSGGVL